MASAQTDLFAQLRELDAMRSAPSGPQLHEANAALHVVPSRLGAVGGKRCRRAANGSGASAASATCKEDLVEGPPVRSTLPEEDLGEGP